MSRTMPTNCEHGGVLDWGDFGNEDRPYDGRCPKCYTQEDNDRDNAEFWAINSHIYTPDGKLRPDCEHGEPSWGWCQECSMERLRGEPMNLCVQCEKPVRLCRCKSFPDDGPTSFDVDFDVYEEATLIAHRQFGSATFPSVSLGGCRPGMVGGKYLHVGRFTTCDGTAWEAVLNLVGFRLVV